MALDSLIKKKRLVILGLNSGTSADGLDMAAVSIGKGRGGLRVEFVSGNTRKYPRALRDEILAVSQADSIGLERLIYLDQALGKYLGRSATNLIRRLEKNGIAIDAVASHGQTVRHLPAKVVYCSESVGGSLQLGALDRIAAATGKIVVGDFRQSDIALGNEGAPITTAAMADMFASNRESRLVVNIGGMSNYFWFPQKKEKRYRAADCGPGNVLSDILSDRLFGEPCDRGGAHAMEGLPSKRLLTLLLANPFFKGVTVSTGRESFGTAVADMIIAFGKRARLSKIDLIATASELTVHCITEKIRSFLRSKQRPGKLYLTGGGAHNRFFVKRLTESTGLPVSSVRELGYDPDLVEACAYSALGAACIRGESIRTRYDTSRNQTIRPTPGKIVQPPGRG